jgi:chromosome segregation ATPase
MGAKNSDSAQGGSYLMVAATDLAGTLARLADCGMTARVAYSEILEELLVRYEEIPNGAQLAEFVSSFNRSRGLSNAKLALGTAGTAAEAVAVFRNKVAKGYRSRLTLESLSGDMTQRVASMFDQIVGEIRGTVAESTRKEVESLHAAHQQELLSLKSETAQQAEVSRSQREDLCQQLDDAIEASNAMVGASAQKDGRIVDLVNALDSLQTRFQLSASKEAVVREKCNHLESRVAELELTNGALVISEHEERKHRLLTLDANRQMALALESEKLQRAALDTRYNDQSERLQTELRRGEQLNHQISDLQIQREDLKAALAASQVRLEAAAKSSPKRTPKKQSTATSPAAGK